MRELIQSQRWHATGSSPAVPFNTVVERTRQRKEALQPEDQTTYLSRYAFICQGQQNAMVELKDIASPGVSTPPATLFTDHAFNQLCTRLAPTPHFAGYARVCPEKLRVLNVNYWMQQPREKEKEVFLRTVRSVIPGANGGSQQVQIIRAVLSERYEVFDDIDLVEALEGIPHIEQAQVRWLDMSETTTHVRLTWPEQREVVREGDIVERGLHISNSEVGCRAVRIQPLVYRLVCTNGLIGASKAGSNVSIRHRGAKHRVHRRIGEAIESVFAQTEQLIAQFRRALTEAIDRPVDEIAALAVAGQLTERSLRNTLQAYLSEPEPNRYAVVNALTRAAGAEQSAERRTEMEHLAGKYLAGMRLPTVPEKMQQKVHRIINV